QNPLSGTAPELSIEENFRLATIRTQPKGFRIGNNDAFRKTVRERIASLNLGLESKLNQPMGSLSGGQRQALTLLMATMDDSKILLMDEPTAALDPATSKLILDIAEKMVQEMGLTAILITHQMKDVIRYGNRLIQLKEGKVIRDFPKIQKQEIQLNELINWFGD
ncbi:MAG TPA: ATP-binding cassette domain-containing protein, partial [Bacteroidia bacterium]|nr:ATP-binding cassette domain-containing protein [Bacteroidia bacterium]